MIRAVRAELRKLRSPLVFWLSVSVALFSVGFGVMSHETANEQLREFEAQVRIWATDPVAPEDLEMTAGPEYDLYVATSLQQSEEWLRVLKTNLGFARASQGPLGAGGLAAATMTGALGVFALLLLAGFHVAGEWGRNSIKEVLVQNNRRAQLVISKLVSLWIAGLWLLAVSWAALALWGVASQRIFPLPVDPSPEAARWSLTLLAKAPLVLLAVAALGLVASVIVRSSVGALSLSALAVVIGAIAVPAVSTLAKLSPPVWIAEWMGFERRDDFVYFLWLQKVRVVDGMNSGLLLLGVAVAATVVSVVVMKRRSALA